MQKPSYFSSKDIRSSASGEIGGSNVLCITYGSFCDGLTGQFPPHPCAELTVVVVTISVLFASFSTLCPIISLAVKV
jgi:hypothetical protein